MFRHVFPLSVERMTGRAPTAIIVPLAMAGSQASRIYGGLPC